MTLVREAVLLDFDHYSQQVYEAVRAFVEGGSFNTPAPVARAGNRRGFAGLGLTPFDERRRSRIEAVTNDAIPGDYEGNFTPAPPMPISPGGTPGNPTQPGGGGGGGGTVPHGPGGEHQGGMSIRLEMPALGSLAGVLALSYVMAHRHDDDVLTVPDTDFPILDRFSNGGTEAFWRLAPGSTSTESAGSGQATISVGGRAMIPGRTYDNCRVSFRLASITAEGSDGVIARGNLNGTNGYVARYVESAATVELLKIANNVETVLATIPAGSIVAGDEISLLCDGSDLSVEFNGVLQTTTSDSTYSSGFAGIGSFGLSSSPFSEFQAFSQ
ncbi:MAG: hypothetical protein JSS51_03965 [Planctomycetes bacterium]|nr:hypothetical protein [Planctomycetota bacterium]